MTKLSHRLSILLNEYPGDEAWNTYVSCFPAIDLDLAKQVAIGEDFARALYWKKGDDLDRVKHWLNKPVTALDGNTVHEILKLEKGNKILRTAIMRMP